MANLLFFPQPFPDESLYSLAVRYHKLAANPGYRVSSHELFGSYSRTCGSILPCCLGALSERLGGAIPVGELICGFHAIRPPSPLSSGQAFHGHLATCSTAIRPGSRSAATQGGHC